MDLMSTTIFAPALAPSAPRLPGLSKAAKGFVNALVASRMRAAEAELRRHRFLYAETDLIHGDYRKVGLDRADLLPFNT
jgi:hypothetical protein